MRIRVHKFRKQLSLLLAIVMLASIMVPFGPVRMADASPQNDQVVISQVYGGGGNSGAKYSHDFIELYNPTDHPVDLTNWKVRYASATGDFNNETSLNGIIQPHHYVLIQQAGTVGSGLPLPASDLEGNLALSGTKGKVDLVNADGESVDLIGYGTVSQAEGQSTPALSSTTAAIRKESAAGPAGNRGLDTDNNAADFMVDSPDPRNSTYTSSPGNPGNTLGPVTASPAPNAWPAGTPITLNPPTVGASVYADVYLSGGEGSGYQLVKGPIALKEPTQIHAYAVQDGSPDGPVTSFKYDILTPTSVAEARGKAKADNVWTEGIITHMEGRETYIQDDSAGIVLYDYPLAAEVGDRVSVAGVMEIYNNLQEIKPHELLSHNITDKNAGLPQALRISGGDLSADQGEAYEARLVYLEDVSIKAENKSGEFTAVQGGREFIIYSALPKLSAGKTFSRVTGVVKQYGNIYELIPINEDALVEDMFSVTASPGSGPIILGGKVTLSSPTEGASIYYTLDGTVPTTASTLYAAPIPIERDTTIKAIVVSGTDQSKVYEFAYTVAKAPRIADIQGEAHASPYKGQTVKDIEGVVTQYGYTFSNGSIKGFYIQDPTPDSNPNTSDAIFVYSTGTDRPKVGDLVTVTGKVAEYNEGSSSNLTSTQIELQSYTKTAEAQKLPEPVTLGKGGRPIPASIIDNDRMATFDPQEDAIDFYESLEGMRVRLPQPTIISPYWTSGGTYNIPTRVENDIADAVTPAGGLVLKEQGNFNPQRLLIAYGNPGQEVSTGDAFAGDVTGVIGYNSGNFKVIPAMGSLPPIHSSPFEQEASTIEVNAEQLRVATYNIENFHPGVASGKITKLAESIVNRIKSPDIIGLVEVQDNNGEQNDGTTSADKSYQALINAIKAAGGPTYSFTDIDPVNNSDGGAPGANIRVGFLYNDERVQLSDSVNNRKGASTESVAYDAASDRLTYNPGRIDPSNAAFAASRKPLAAQFDFRGEKVIVIANHFNSKSGDQGPFGSTQPPVLGSEGQRHRIAAAVNGFVKDIKTGNPDANVIVLGDMNDFQFTQTATILKGNELDNLIERLPLEEQYTYTYDGNSQVLDHILVSKNLTRSAQVDVVHLNADFPASKGRVSDHDPVIAQLDLKGKAGGFPLTVLHTNDTHANLDTVSSPDNIARRVAAIKEARAGAVNPLLVDAGDVFSGTLYFNQYLGQADLEFMNLVQYDAMTFGNHEFDKGSEVLNDFIEHAEFPFISSNVNFSADPLLSKKFRNGVTSNPADAAIYPAAIVDVNGEQVGLIGLTTEDTSNISSPGAVTFDNAVQKAKDTVKMLQNERINKIVVLSHLGYDVDVQLAKEVEGIDIIVGGHSHTKLDQAVVDRTDSAPKLIVQTGEKGQFLGKLEVKFDEEGTLQEWDSALISVDAKDSGGKYVITPDQEALDILNAKYKPGVEQLKQTEVGKTEVKLNGVRSDVRTKETNLGNLIADGMLDAAKAAGTNAVIALQNGGGIRESIEAGKITMGDVMTVLPFNNDLVTITLTGQEIKEAMENGVSKAPAADGRFPHIAGMKFFYDSTKPAGQRVLRIEVKGKNGYQPIELNKSYEVATNAFTAKGGDFYASLEKAYREGRVNLLYLPDYEVFSNYVKKVGTVTARTSAVEGRITDLKGAPLPGRPDPEVPGGPGSPGGSGGSSTSGSPGPTTPPVTPTNPGTTAPAEPGKIKLQVKAENGAAAGTVTGKAMKEALKQPAGGKITVEVTSTQPFESSSVTIENEALTAWLNQSGASVLTILTPYGSYELPKREIHLQAIADKTRSGIGGMGLVFTLSMNGEAVKEAASEGYKALKAVNFAVAVQTGSGDKMPLGDFKSYVKRSLNVGQAYRANEIAVVRLNEKGQNGYTPVPFKASGDRIEIYSRSNGTYLVLLNPTTFEDIASHWSKADVESLAAKMIVTGRTEQRYVPNAFVTRAEFVALITRALGLAANDQASSFKDITAADWYAGQVHAAVQAGIVNGYADGTFRPKQTITREEMALMAYKALNYAGYKPGGASKSRFADESEISAWAKEAVNALNGLNIMQGDRKQQFTPKSNTTRGESAAVLNRMIQNLTYDK
ncbi:5'-nucleotidase C-terminal domain-containing protein [Paenibacillus sp. DMB20]|uniref:5'-nucleotidase C-terminal domain-containing protein n=1 Tax=Paenibacillus sp. DMB20 TaxID=1642570 RepID=UPI000627B01F|nr:5'-nucleotidase C-terminal domain-containing protein [Paenibacillus sp. DMB20]KKO50758.1 5'-nucleotidase [Paenibacillus sp. DMB20]